MRQGFGVHVAAISNSDITFVKGSAVKPLSALLIGQSDKTKALVRKVESAMKPP